MRGFAIKCLFGVYVLIGGLFAFFTIPQTGWKAVSVHQTEMQPAVQSGSLALVQKVGLDEVLNGDLIAFQAKAGSSEPLIRRVMEVSMEDGAYSFSAKGEGADATTQAGIAGKSVAGKVLFSIPQAGAALDWLLSAPGLAIWLGLPGAVALFVAGRRTYQWWRKRRTAKKVIKEIAKEPVNEDTVNEVVAAELQPDETVVEQVQDNPEPLIEPPAAPTFEKAVEPEIKPVVSVATKRKPMAAGGVLNLRDTSKAAGKAVAAPRRVTDVMR